MYKVSLRKLEEGMKNSFLGWIPVLHKIEKFSAVTMPVFNVLHQLELPCSYDRISAYAYNANIFL